MPHTPQPSTCPTGLLALTVVVDEHDTILSGRVVDDAGHARPFHGWMEFAAAVDDCLPRQQTALRS